MTGLDVVLVHGAWAGPWVWDRIAPMLAAEGHRILPAVLPGAGADADPTIGLAEVVDAVLDQLAGADRPLLLVGHSGGGVVVTQLAELIPERVAGVAYLAGMMLPSGASFADLCDEAGLVPPVGISAHVAVDADRGLSSVPPEAGARIFFHAADPAEAIAAAGRLVPQSERARLAPPTWTAGRFGSLPRLYVEALRDRSVPLAVQRRMQERTPGAEVVAIDTDHAPQLSRPDDVARALLAFATRTATP